MKSIAIKGIWTKAAILACISFFTMETIFFVCSGNSKAENIIINLEGTIFIVSGIGLGILSIMARKDLSKIEFWGSIFFALIIISALTIPYLIGDIRV
jgi:hypothetical protein